jgi:hypothetical protein
MTKYPRLSRPRVARLPRGVGTRHHRPIGNTWRYRNGTGQMIYYWKWLLSNHFLL